MVHNVTVYIPGPAADRVCVFAETILKEEGAAMPTERIHTGIRFDEETLTKITFIAKKSCRSINAQLEYLAKKCIEEYESQKGVIQPQADAPEVSGNSGDYTKKRQTWETTAQSSSPAAVGSSIASSV